MPEKPYGNWTLDADDPARNMLVDAVLANKSQMVDKEGVPTKASHTLGEVRLKNGKTVKMHVVHAVDPVITDGESVVVINRRFDPGIGKPTLPGGFLDPKEDGTVESLSTGAAREAAEEAGIVLEEGKPIGRRQFNRPHDIRIAQSDELFDKYGIKQGDIFLVSTQAVKFDVPDLKEKRLSVGDDATPGSARLMKINQLTPADMGVADHFMLINAVMSEQKAHSR